MTIQLNIIDESLPTEQMIKRIWDRNVFFISFYSLLMISVFIGAVFHRTYCAIIFIKDKITNKTSIRCRKVYKTKWFERWLCMITENFWHILWLMLFFVFMSISKFVYHIVKILWWITKKIIWPLMWFILAFMFVSSFNNNKYGK